MTPSLRTNWWALVLRGVVAIILGIVAFALPGVTVAALVTLFGIYALIDGVLAIVLTVKAAEVHGRWGGFLLEGILGLLFGIVAIAAPIAVAAVFIQVLAIWALITGVLEIVAAFRLRRSVEGEWLLILVGVLSILFGIVLFAEPVAGAVVLVWILAAYGLFFGVLLIVLGFRLRNHPGRRLSAQQLG